VLLSFVFLTLFINNRYVFRDEDYLMKICTELRFLNDKENHKAKTALNEIDFSLNPFICPIPLRHDQTITAPNAPISNNSSIDITNEINDNSTINNANNTNDSINNLTNNAFDYHWATKNEFHDTTHRLVDGVDILQIRDVSLFVIDEIRDKIDLSHEQQLNSGGDNQQLPQHDTDEDENSLDDDFINTSNNNNKLYR